MILQPVATKPAKTRFGHKVYLVLVPDGLSPEGERVVGVALTAKAASETAMKHAGGTFKKWIATK